jgi:hypothetical protein
LRQSGYPEDLGLEPNHFHLAHGRIAGAQVFARVSKAADVDADVSPAGFRIRDDLPRIIELFQTFEALRTCPTARRIQENFEQWASPDREASIVGLDYWGL